VAELQAPTGAFLLVELHADLAQHATTLRGVWAGLRQVAGIKRITDLSYVSIDGLEETVLMRLTLDEQRMFRRARKAKTQQGERNDEHDRRPAPGAG
jgi:hypothetical protein